MKTAIKLVLIYLLIAQIIAPILMMIPCTIYLWATTGNLDRVVLTQMVLIPAQLAGQIMMGVYLWKAGYISKQRETWLPVSGPYLVCSAIAILTCGFVVSSLMSLLDWIPNIMKQSFDILQSGWGGILAIAVVGPVLEELLFRGAITRALLQQYNPTRAILISALLFGVFHINPAQILPAFLIGILLAWTYYRTDSLIPCTFMHILNNSLAVYLSIRYPEAENMDDLMSGTPYLITLFGSILLFIGVIQMMHRLTSPKRA
ncbi:lysostaphin resistance A-like protein [Bacteroides sp. AN502(2024)]|uniref:CPBP family intramembrane glutamic endopeptidase n=1 Tax=Bacteroides sp. AN502(2024) TaxID=3160599 RepID=UPI0035169104